MTRNISITDHIDNELASGMQSMELDEISARERIQNERNIAEIVEQLCQSRDAKIFFLTVSYSFDWLRTKRILVEAATRSNHVVFFDDWSDDEPPTNPMKIFFVRDIDALGDDPVFTASFMNDQLPPSNEGMAALRELQPPAPGTAQVILNWVDEHTRFDTHIIVEPYRRCFGKNYKVAQRMVSDKSIRWISLVVLLDGIQ